MDGGTLLRDQNARLAADYDALAYPSGVFAQTHPARLAAVARLHGLDAPPVGTARVLEIGGGDGLNAMAMAAAYPGLRALSVDIAPDVVRRGEALARAAGLGNCRVELADVIDMAGNATERFDYVIAHGLYAWVPEAVRRATVALIGRVLADDGIAFVSYNAMPGGHIRMALRDLVLHRIADVSGIVERAEAARAVLEAHARPREDDSVLMRGLRSQAGLMARKPTAAIGHDELSPHFAPQYLGDVAAAAARHGLAYLADATGEQLVEGFPPAPDGRAPSEAEVLEHARRQDHEALRFFRQSLFVRAGRSIARTLDPARAAGLWLSTGVRPAGGTGFTTASGEAFDVGDDGLAVLLAAAAQIAPGRVALADLGRERLGAVVALAASGLVTLHAAPLPAVPPSTHPRASPLALAQIARGDGSIARLDHAMVDVAEEGPRVFVALLDGSRDRAALEQAWAATPYAGQVGVGEALAMVAALPLLVA